jgi:hypothetical protein
VSGKVAPDTVNPVPLTVAELIVSAAVPLEVSVRDCVDGEFTDTFPNAMLLALRLSVGVPGFNCKANFAEALPALAVSVAVCVVLTADIVAENAALVAPAATVAVVGTVTAELLLARLTANPPLGAAPFSVTVQLSVPAPVIEELEQESELSVAMPVPLRATLAVPPEEALLEIVSDPVAAPARVGSNCAVSVAVWFGFSVTGNVAPDTLKPVPLTVAELIVSAAVPLEVSVSDCVEAVFRLTFPNERLLALNAIVGTAAFNCRAKLVVALPAFAVSIAVCVVLTADTVAENVALVAPAVTVAVAGTVTDELLLARLTANPPLGAAPFSVTVQLSVPAPVIEELEQDIELSVAMPVPLRATLAVPPEEALLEIASDPVAAPVTVGSNCTVSVAV